MENVQVCVGSAESVLRVVFVLVFSDLCHMSPLLSLFQFLFHIVSIIADFDEQ